MEAKNQEMLEQTPRTPITPRTPHARIESDMETSDSQLDPAAVAYEAGWRRRATPVSRSRASTADSVGGRMPNKAELVLLGSQKTKLMKHLGLSLAEYERYQKDPEGFVKDAVRKRGATALATSGQAGRTSGSRSKKGSGRNRSATATATGPTAISTERDVTRPTFAHIMRSQQVKAQIANRRERNDPLGAGKTERHTRIGVKAQAKKPKGRRGRRRHRRGRKERPDQLGVQNSESSGLVTEESAAENGTNVYNSSQCAHFGCIEDAEPANIYCLRHQGDGLSTIRSQANSVSRARSRTGDSQMTMNDAESEVQLFIPSDGRGPSKSLPPPGGRILSNSIDATESKWEEDESVSHPSSFPNDPMHQQVMIDIPHHLVRKKVFRNQDENVNSHSDAFNFMRIPVQGPSLVLKDLTCDLPTDHPILTSIPDLSDANPSDEGHSNYLVRALGPLTGVFTNGSLTVILGTQTSGASVLLRLLAGQVEPRHVSGSVVYQMPDGDVHNPCSSNLLAYRVAPTYPALGSFIASSDHLPGHMTCLEVLRHTANMLKVRMRYYWENDMALRLESVLRLVYLYQSRKVAVANLSVDQRWRLRLAVTLLHRPSMLLIEKAELDGMPSGSTIVILRTLKSLCSLGYTVIVHASNMLWREYAMVDKVAVMSHGSILYKGAPFETLSFFESVLKIKIPKQVNGIDFLVDLVTSLEGSSASSLSQLTWAEQHAVETKSVAFVLQQYHSTKNFIRDTERVESVFLSPKVKSSHRAASATRPGSMYHIIDHAESTMASSTTSISHFRSTHSRRLRRRRSSGGKAAAVQEPPMSCKRQGKLEWPSHSRASGATNVSLLSSFFGKFFSREPAYRFFYVYTLLAALLVGAGWAGLESGSKETAPSASSSAFFFLSTFILSLLSIAPSPSLVHTFRYVREERRRLPYSTTSLMLAFSGTSLLHSVWVACLWSISLVLVQLHGSTVAFGSVFLFICALSLLVFILHVQQSFFAVLFLDSSIEHASFKVRTALLYTYGASLMTAGYLLWQPLLLHAFKYVSFASPHLHAYTLLMLNEAGPSFDAEEVLYSGEMSTPLFFLLGMAFVWLVALALVLRRKTTSHVYHYHYRVPLATSSDTAVSQSRNMIVLLHMHIGFHLSFIKQQMPGITTAKVQYPNVQRLNLIRRKTRDRVSSSAERHTKEFTRPQTYQRALNGYVLPSAIGRTSRVSATSPQPSASSDLDVLKTPITKGDSSYVPPSPSQEALVPGPTPATNRMEMITLEPMNEKSLAAAATSSANRTPTSSTIRTPDNKDEKEGGKVYTSSAPLISVSKPSDSPSTSHGEDEPLPPHLTVPGRRPRMNPSQSLSVRLDQPRLSSIESLNNLLQRSNRMNEIAKNLQHSMHSPSKPLRKLTEEEVQNGVKSDVEEEDDSQILNEAIELAEVNPLYGGPSGSRADLGGAGEVDDDDEEGEDEDGEDYGVGAYISYYRVAVRRSGPKNKVVMAQTSGVIRPGSITTVLGTPDSGKSTLLRVIAGQYIGDDLVQHGEVHFNGRAATEAPGVVSYVPSQLCSAPHSTVMSTLIHSARMQLPQMDNSRLITRVEVVMQMMGLMPYAEHELAVGSEPIEQGLTTFTQVQPQSLSRSLRRMTAIACAILPARPVLVLENPAHDLLPGAQRRVARVLKALASKGYTIVLSLDQPRRDLLLLLQYRVIIMSCGIVVYKGAVASLAKHLNSIGIAPPAHESVLTYFLDVVSISDVETRKVAYEGGGSRVRKLVTGYEELVTRVVNAYKESRSRVRETSLARSVCRGTVHLNSSHRKSRDFSTPFLPTTGRVVSLMVRRYMSGYFVSLRRGWHHILGFLLTFASVAALWGTEESATGPGAGSTEDFQLLSYVLMTLVWGALGVYLLYPFLSLRRADILKQAEATLNSYTFLDTSWVLSPLAISASLLTLLVDVPVLALASLVMATPSFAAGFRFGMVDFFKYALVLFAFLSVELALLNLLTWACPAPGLQRVVHVPHRSRKLESDVKRLYKQTVKVIHRAFYLQTWSLYLTFTALNVVFCGLPLLLNDVPVWFEFPFYLSSMQYAITATSALLFGHGVSEVVSVPSVLESEWEAILCLTLLFVLLQAITSGIIYVRMRNLLRRLPAEDSLHSHRSRGVMDPLGGDLSQSNTSFSSKFGTRTLNELIF